VRVTLLGTGGSAGVPMIGGADGRGDWGACNPNEPRNRRSRSSILLQDRGATLLVDTSPDMRTQLLAAAVTRVDAILFTHPHADHVTGLDDVRMLNRLADAPLDAFATQDTLSELKRRFEYAFMPWEKPNFFRPVLTPRVVSAGQTVTAGGIKVGLFEQDHGFITSLGLRVGGFGYSTDAVALDDTAFATLAGVEIWVVGCYQREPHRTHAWVERALDWVARLRPRRAILTHMGPDLDGAWLRSTLPPGVEPGHDGMVLELE
jgi:phosphoribosyl 1,2-cyclic phosphate phosphodiesterase